jgi:demethylspheroidene O-methyltransferase
VHRALAPGGTVVIGEPLAGTRGAAAMGDAYFGLYLHAMGSGRPRTAAELQQMLAAAGFDSVRNVPTARPLLASVLTARKPGQSRL